MISERLIDANALSPNNGMWTTWKQLVKAKPSFWISAWVYFLELIIIIVRGVYK